METVWTVWAENEESEPLMAGAATSEDKAKKMVSRLETEFGDAFQYSVVCVKTDVIRVNDNDIRI